MYIRVRKQEWLYLEPHSILVDPDPEKNPKGIRIRTCATVIEIEGTWNDLFHPDFTVLVHNMNGHKISF
jgi:hypothetical protein